MFVVFTRNGFYIYTQCFLFNIHIRWLQIFSDMLIFLQSDDALKYIELMYVDILARTIFTKYMHRYTQYLHSNEAIQGLGDAMVKLM